MNTIQNPKSSDFLGVSLAGGISIGNLSTYARQTVKKPVAYGGKKIIQAGPIRRNRAKVGRNDPCPCGSGQKVKSCCPKWL